MKTIPAQDLRTNLEAILSSAQSERIVISRHGKPCALLVGIEDYDAEDLTLASSHTFWEMIRQRRTRGKSIPLAEVEKRLRITRSRKPASKQAASTKRQKNR
jgi:prevent-host-death family protein